MTGSAKKANVNTSVGQKQRNQTPNSSAVQRPSTGKQGEDSSGKGADKVKGVMVELIGESQGQQTKIIMHRKVWEKQTTRQNRTHKWKIHYLKGRRRQQKIRTSKITYSR